MLVGMLIFGIFVQVLLFVSTDVCKRRILLLSLPPAIWVLLFFSARSPYAPNRYHAM